MKPNLDTLKSEIEHYLEESGLAVFYGYSRVMDSMAVVYWDCDQYPDYTLFVKAARAAGAKVMVLHQLEFHAEQLDDALEQLQECDLPREEHDEFERRLNEMRIYGGFIFSIALFFSHERRVVFFYLRRGWDDENTEMVYELQILCAP